MSKPNWTGTKQRNDLKTCPFCDTKAVQQVRLAESDTNMQFRIGCSNPECFVEPNTPPFAALDDAEWAWQEREESSASPVEAAFRMRFLDELAQTDIEDSSAARRHAAEEAHSAISDQISDLYEKYSAR